MRHIVRFLVALPAMALAAGCADLDRPAQLPADLRQDLDLAHSTSVELASAARRDAPATSALEQVPAGAAAQSERAPVAAPRAQRPPALTQVARRSPRTAPAPVPVAEAADDAAADAAAGEDAAPAPAAPEPELVAGPPLEPEGVGSGRPRDPGGFGGYEGTGEGGSVVRGGGRVDVDDCLIFPGGIGIGRRYPSPRGPIYAPPVVRGGTGDVGGRSRAGGVRSRGAGTAVIGGGAPRGTGGGSVAAGPRRRN